MLPAMLVKSEVNLLIPMYWFLVHARMRYESPLSWNKFKSRDSRPTYRGATSQTCKFVNRRATKCYSVGDNNGVSSRLLDYKRRSQKAKMVEEEENQSKHDSPFGLSARMGLNGP